MNPAPMTRAATPRHVVALAALAALLATLIPSTPSGAGTPTTVVLHARTTVAAVVDAVEAVGGVIDETLDNLGMVVATVPSAGIEALGVDEDVRSVTPDRTYVVHSRSAKELGAPSWTAADTIGARSSGFTGDGVGVAIIDTGVTEVPSLQGKIAGAIDVSGEGRFDDGYGHGTFMAGLVVGNEVGVAPDAHVLSVKVANRAGVTSLTSVLRGLSVTLDAPEDFNVKVALLAIGRPFEDAVDPMMAAVEQLWAHGITVVVPAGNDGSDGLSTPGVDPYALSVGALDDAGTADHADDSVPDWTAVGPTGPRNGPDVVAPGKSLVSSRLPGSLVDRSHRASQIGDDWFRGSGTSMAAAVAAGAAALVSQSHPAATPDEVKGRLVATAAGAPAGSVPEAVGNGVLSVADAITGPAVMANGDFPAIEILERTATGGSYPVWTGNNWAGVQWSGNNWAGNNWAEQTWAGVQWSGNNWAGNNWAGVQWSGNNWAGVQWSGNNWAGNNWAGVQWSGNNWAGNNWAGNNWASDVWTGSNWN